MYRVPDLIHVGLQKTGTSLLQRRIFPLFRPAVASLRGRDIELVGDRFVRLRDVTLPPSEHVLYSRENLVSRAEHMVENDLSVAERLAAASPGSRIVISLRSQFTILRSMFGLAVKNGYKAPFGDFIGEIIDLDKLNYFAIVSRFRQVFGRERVLVLLFEDLIDEPQLSTNLLASFFSMAPPIVSPALPIERRSENDTALMVRRLANRVRSNFGKSVLLRTGGAVSRVAGRILGFDVVVERRIPAIERSFAESNRALFGDGKWTERIALYPGLEQP
jgi:hypothetical protein